MFKRMIAVLAIILAGTAPALAKRVALVLGNGAYEHTVQLPNPANDAEQMAAKLKALGFEVVAGQDQTYGEMRRSVMDFAKKAYGADIAILFYAGHGLQVAGQNHLVPIDATIEDETSLDFETITVDFIMRQMSKDVKVQMVFLDACRDNPLARTLARRMGPSRSGSIGAGLAEIKIQETGGEGSVIAFATSPGDVALDGDGANSPFTSALIRHIDTPNASIQTVMTRVTGEVYEETEKKQRPWVNASLIGESIKRLEAGSQVASVNPTVVPGAATAPAASTTGVVATLPDPQKAVPGTEATEASLGWNRTARREVQTRLNLAGQDVGRPDGAFGPKTRAGVSAWQAANGIVATGYFTAAQYALLTSQTATQYSVYQAEVNRKQQAAASASRSATSTRRTNNTTTRRANNNNGGSINPAGAAFIGGVVGGIIGGAIGR